MFQYCRNLKIFKKIMNFFIAFFLCGVCVLALRILFKVLLLNARPSLSLVMLLTTEIFSELCFSLEHVIFYIFISMFIFLLRCLNEYVSDIIKYYDEQEQKKCVGRNETIDHLTEKQIEEWTTNYMFLIGCSKELSPYFCFQLNRLTMHFLN